MTEDHAQSAVRKASRRLIPFLVLCYAVNFLDRVDVGFAGLAMNDDSASRGGVRLRRKHLLPWLFSFRSSQQSDPRKDRRAHLDRTHHDQLGRPVDRPWVYWNDTSFYGLRFIFGVAEAGFFPGSSCISPTGSRRGARPIVAMFMVAVPLATVIGGPVSGVLIGLHGVAGLTGWRWLFFIEGMPAVLLGRPRSWSSPNGRRTPSG